MKIRLRMKFSQNFFLRFLTTEEHRVLTPKFPFSSVKLCVLCGFLFVFVPGIHAEFYWGLDAGFSVQFFHHKNSLGERAQRTIMVGDTERFNGRDGFFTGAQNWNPVSPPSLDPHGFNRGEYSHFSHLRHLFSFGRGGWGNANILRFSFGYRTDTIAFHTRVNLDPLVSVNPNNLGTGQNEFGGGDPSFMTDDGRSPNWSALLRYSFEEFYIRAVVGPLTGFVGTTPNRGKVQTFNNKSEMILGGNLRIENFGINAPNANADFVHDGLDTNNLLRSGARTAGTDDVIKALNLPYFMFAVALGDFLPVPLTIQLAADPGNHAIGNNLVLDYRRMHGAVRLSAENLFNRVNIDAIYKIAGGDPNILDLFDEDNNPHGPHEPDGGGILVHNWGLYANILNLRGFDFGLGYSGYLDVRESNFMRDTGVIRTETSPLFTGFDLRIRYTGVPNLTITSFNNVSFARTERSSPDALVIGVTGTRLPDKGVSQSWFALYNALTVHYSLTSQLTVALQAASRYGVITSNGFTFDHDFFPDATVIRTRHTVGGGGFINYRIFHYAEIQLGVTVRYLMQSYTNSAPGTQDFHGTRNARGGAFDFAIPIQLMFRF